MLYAQDKMPIPPTHVRVRQHRRLLDPGDLGFSILQPPIYAIRDT